MSESMRALMAPTSVAVIGASADPRRIGGRPIAWMKSSGFAGVIYPVNPNRDEIQGFRAYPSVQSLPEAPDAAVIAVPSSRVLETVNALGTLGARSAIIFSAEFAEVGAQGAMLQNQIVETAQRHGMRLLGPNCLGMYNARVGWYPTFSSAFEEGWPLPGRVGIVSQSGAFGSYLASLARNRGIGVPLCVMTGNEADISVGDIIQWFVDDPETDVIMAYAEGIKHAASFVRALEAARRAGKPVVVMKVGSSELGNQAAASHTASIAGDDVVTDAVLREFGALRARSADEMLDIAYAATYGAFPHPNTLGVMTLSGGVGVMVSDAAEELGIAMPPVPESSQAKLKELVPYASPRNPVDCTAQAVNDISLVTKFLREMLDAGNYSSVLAFFAQGAGTPAFGPRLANDMIAIRKQYPERVFAVVGTATPELVHLYNEARIMTFEDPTRATVAIGALGKFGASFARPDRLAAPPAKPVTLPRAAISEAQAKMLLAEAGISVAPERVCSTAEEALAAAQELSYPVVMKILSPDIPHKTEIGGVLLNVSAPEEVRAGFATLMQRAASAAPEAKLEGVLVARQLKGGVECILGIHRDPIFGPIAMFGLGGIFVEVLKDVVFQPCPFGPDVAHEMINNIRASAVLQGARNLPKCDTRALADMLSQLSAFAAEAGPQLRSIDLNPVMVMPEGQGAYVLDALIDIAPGDAASHESRASG